MWSEKWYGATVIQKIQNLLDTSVMVSHKMKIFLLHNPMFNWFLNSAMKAYNDTGITKCNKMLDWLHSSNGHQASALVNGLSWTSPSKIVKPQVYLHSRSKQKRETMMFPTWMFYTCNDLCNASVISSNSTTWLAFSGVVKFSSSIFNSAICFRIFSPLSGNLEIVSWRIWREQNTTINKTESWVANSVNNNHQSLHWLSNGYIGCCYKSPSNSEYLGRSGRLNVNNN